MAGARRARAPAFWREEGDDWRGQSAGPACWAKAGGPPGEARYDSLSLFYFVFVFYFLTFVLYLKEMLKHFHKC